MTQVTGTGQGIGAVAGNGATPTSATQREELAKAAKAFEAIFMRQMVGAMRGASLGESIDGSSAVDQFQEMADARMADGLADKGGLGIAAMLLKQLDKH